MPSAEPNLGLAYLKENSIKCNFRVDWRNVTLKLMEDKLHFLQTSFLNINRKQSYDFFLRKKLPYQYALVRKNKYFKIKSLSIIFNVNAITHQTNLTHLSNAVNATTSNL